MQTRAETNILIYAHLFPPSKGGMQFSNLEIAKGLKELGYKITVIACNNKGIRSFAYSLPFPVIVLPKWPFTPMSSLNKRGFANWLFSPLYFGLIKTNILKIKPHIALVSDETANAFWGLFSPFLRVPYISYCSVPQLAYKRSTNANFLGYLIQSRIRKWMGQSYIRSSKVLAVSSSTKSELIKELPLLTNKVEVIPRSIDPIFFDSQPNYEQLELFRKKYDIGSDDYVLLTVSRLAKGKGVGDILNSMSLLEPAILKKIKFFVVGSGANEPYLRKLTRDLTIDKNVIFIGSVPHNRLIDYYDLCNLFLMPSRRGKFESFGRVFVEAASRNVTSVGANSGGMTDIIEHGKNGYLIRPGDINELKNILEKMIRNKELSDKMGRIARKMAENRFTRRAIALEIEKHLKKEIARFKNIKTL